MHSHRIKLVVIVVVCFVMSSDCYGDHAVNGAMQRCTRDPPQEETWNDILLHNYCLICGLLKEMFIIQLYYPLFPVY